MLVRLGVLVTTIRQDMVREVRCARHPLGEPISSTLTWDFARTRLNGTPVRGLFGAAPGRTESDHDPPRVARDTAVLGQAELGSLQGGRRQDLTDPTRATLSPSPSIKAVRHCCCAAVTKLDLAGSP